MKYLMILLTFLTIPFLTSAQAPEHLRGKWQLVKWTYKGKDMSIKDTYKTDHVYEVLKNDNVFVSLIGDQVMEGEWAYNPADSTLRLNAGVVRAQYKLESVDENRRVVSSPMIGRLEYVSQPQSLRYIIRAPSSAGLTVNGVDLEDILQPGPSFEALSAVGTIADSSRVGTEYGDRWYITMPGILLEYIDAGEPVLARMRVSTSDIPVLLDGENVFEMVMDEPTLSRLKAQENRGDQMDLMEKFGGAPDYMELLVDPSTGKVTGLILEIGS